MAITTPGESLADRLVTGGTAAGTRVYPQAPTQDPTGDWIVYKKSSGGGGKRLSARNSLQSYQFRIDCFSTTQAGAETLMQQVLTRLTGWADKPNGVHGCFDSEDQDDGQAEDGGGDQYRVAGQTFELWFLRS